MAIGNVKAVIDGFGNTGSRVGKELSGSLC